MAELADALDLGSSVIDVGVQVPSAAPKEKQRFDTKVLNLFSLHIGSSFLSVSKQQSLVGVFNRTFARLFFFIYNNYGTKALSTRR